MKLLLDENLPPGFAKWLIADGFDAVAALDVGLGGASDSAVRQFAIESSRILVTLDSDFGNLLRFPTAETPGVIRLKIHPPTQEDIGNELRRSLALLKPLDLRGKLAVVNKGMVRIRS